MAKILDTYFVTVRIQATYTLQVPAEEVGEAIQSAYNIPVLSERLYDIEKSVVTVMKLVETENKVSLTAERCR